MKQLFVGIIVIVLLSFGGQGQFEAQEATILNNYPDCNFTTSEDEAGLQLGAVVIDLDTRLGCVQNLERVFNVASVPKIFIAAAYYDGLINGTINSAGRLQFTRNYWMGGSNDCLRETDIGNVYTYEELVEFMINCSDNAATWMMMDTIGSQRVNAYVQTLGIADIGEIIPYSEVDRLKLTFLDERWATIPAGIVSRYYRSGDTSGLLEYFSEIPARPNRDEFTAINQQYFDTYTYNTLTPYAMAEFILLMRDYLIDGTPQQWYVATSVFNVMLYTQRQYSTQSMHGQAFIASKNGFDRGLLAEVNVLFNDLDNRVPSGIVLLFGQYDSLSGGRNNAQLPNRFGDALNDTFFALSPQIRDVMYPNYRQPTVQTSFMLSTVVFNDQSSIATCWNPFFNADFDATLVPTMENCFNNMRPRITYPVGENLALGLILRNLNFSDTRLTFLYTAPDNRQYSYQIDRQNVTSSGIYWFHPIDMAGQWQVDIYVNLIHAHSETILAQR
ncbi:MAG: serine hydrolase [Phototrophicaceae bacterium]